MPNAESERVRLLARWARHHLPEGEFLDVGSAGGGDPFTLRAVLEEVRTKCHITAIDVDAKGLLEVARLTHVSTVAADLYRLPFPRDTFNGCLMAEVLEHVYDAIGALRELARVLKSGGVLLLTTPNPLAGARVWESWFTHPCPWDKSNLDRGLGNWPGEERVAGSAHIQFYDPLSLCNLIRDAGFEIEEVCSTNRSLPSGFPWRTPSRKRQPLVWLCWKYLRLVAQKRFGSLPLARAGVYTAIRAAKR